MRPFLLPRARVTCPRDVAWRQRPLLLASACAARIACLTRRAWLSPPQRRLQRQRSKTAPKKLRTHARAMFAAAPGCAALAPAAYRRTRKAAQSTCLRAGGGAAASRRATALSKVAPARLTPRSLARPAPQACRCAPRPRATAARHAQAPRVRAPRRVRVPPAAPRARLRVRLTAYFPRAEAPTALPPAISLTDASLVQLKKLKAESKGQQLVLRIGVKSGGCSGMRRVPSALCCAMHALPRRTAPRVERSRCAAPRTATQPRGARAARPKRAACGAAPALRPRCPVAL
jgi:hypothetical protein